ncbi:Mobile element protein [Polaromonas sp. CG9_12]|nr:Mobile element protein [Polaromonas sp. CG9_12]
MPTPKINMRKLKDALRLKLVGGQSHQQIASALGIAKGIPLHTSPYHRQLNH